MIPRAFNSIFSNAMKMLICFIHSNEDKKEKLLNVIFVGPTIEHYFASRGLVTSIGYRGNGKAYTTPTRTLFDRFTLFVYDPFVYPSDI